MHDDAFADRLLAAARRAAAAALGADALADGELLAALDVVGTLRRLADAAGAALSAEVAARSAAGDEATLARRMGARSPATLVAETARIDPATAAAWVASGTATAPRTSLLGERLPEAHPAAARALGAGSIDAATARIVIATVEQCCGGGIVGGRAGEAAVEAAAVEAAAVEAEIVRHATTLSPRDAARLCRQVLACHAPEDTDAREAALRARRGLRIVQLPDGITRIGIDADPESAGYLLTALDARTAPRRRVRFVDPGDGASGASGGGTSGCGTSGCSTGSCGCGDAGASGCGASGCGASGCGANSARADNAPGDHAPAADDTRNLAQRRLDALVDIAREAIGRDPGELAGAAVTMLVTVPLVALTAGLNTTGLNTTGLSPTGPSDTAGCDTAGCGTAAIAGVDEPIGAATARRLAAAADIIPVVLGGPSEPLDLGQSQRLFSPAQRRALALRDGGCTWPGCNAPPSWCEAAHLVPWYAGGPTDLDNAALLCRWHHTVYDTDGWQMERRGGIPWFIPPPWVDSSLAPRRGGRPRPTAA
ncbi:MAG: DUF222 domain-containing protein [Microbacteriaceae bacterium]